MNPSLAIAFALLAPVAGAIGIAFSGRHADSRETVTLLTAVVLFLVVLSLLPVVVAGGVPTLHVVEMLPGLSIAFSVEPLGMLFALVASGLWIINSLYSIGYMRGNKEHDQTRFYVCFAVSIAAALGIAFSANMFTLFIFYEVLTLSTWPLVTHKGNDEAKRGGRIYLGILISTSIGLLLVGMIWMWSEAGTLEFTKGGVLPEDMSPAAIGFMLALFMFGIGKAALMPFHRWLPAAMVAPTPVSALLHAVAVVKAGVFTVLKVIVYLFGVERLSETGSSEWLVWAACFTLTVASLVALRKDNLKARLAYSTIGQLSYVVAGAALATSFGIIGGALQIAMHAVGKITLFFCAGAIYTATHRTEISQMDGLGRVMPFTYAAFFIGSLSIIGLPPLGGSWAKWYLILGAADTGQKIMIGALLLSSLLNIAYLMPIVFRGFFAPAVDADKKPMEDGFEPGEEKSAMSTGRIKEAPLFCVVPLCLTAIGCIILFFTADSIVALIEPIVSDR